MHAIEGSVLAIYRGFAYRAPRICVYLRQEDVFILKNECFGLRGGHCETRYGGNQTTLAKIAVRNARNIIVHPRIREIESNLHYECMRAEN